MKKLVVTWAILRLIWESRGYSMKEMPDRLRVKWPERKGLAFTSIQHKASVGKPAPPEIAKFVMDEAKLPVRPGYEKPAEVVRLGLEALRGQSAPSKAPPQLALDLLAHFPTNEVALKLADALAKQATAKGSALGKLARRVARLTVKRLGVDVGKLGALFATLNDVDAKVDLQDFQRQRDKREILWTVRGTGLAVAAVVVVGLLLLAASGRHVPEIAAQPPVVIVANVGPGGATAAFDVQSLLGAVAGEIGEKVMDRPIPDSPLPNQKRPPCLGEAYEHAIGGGCWAEIGDAKPPCGRFLYRSGDKCYRPIAADPSKTVGE